MLAVGLTGGLATGKSTVAGMFKRLGAEVMDADKIVHELLKRKGPCFKPVVAKFGVEILTKGHIDRQKLAQIVFNDSSKLKKLTGIIHPAVKKEIGRQIKERRKREGILIVEIPLLFETDFDRSMDINIVVKSTRAQQIRRAVRKFGITEQLCQRRLRAQMPLEKKIRLADIIIDNSHSLRETQHKVRMVWQKLNRIVNHQNH